MFEKLRNDDEAVGLIGRRFTFSESLVDCYEESSPASDVDASTISTQESMNLTCS